MSRAARRRCSHCLWAHSSGAQAARKFGRSIPDQACTAGTGLPARSWGFSALPGAHTQSEIVGDGHATGKTQSHGGEHRPQSGKKDCLRRTEANLFRHTRQRTQGTCADDELVLVGHRQSEGRCRTTRIQDDDRRMSAASAGPFSGIHEYGGAKHRAPLATGCCFDATS
jgi:hypothetical protein